MHKDVPRLLKGMLVLGAEVRGRSQWLAPPEGDGSPSRVTEGRWVAFEWGWNGDGSPSREMVERLVSGGSRAIHRLRVVAWQGELLYEDDGTARPSDPPAQIASILALLLVRPPPRHATPRQPHATPALGMPSLS